MNDQSRKRPCSVCGKWFEPNPRTRGCQRTCGNTECQSTQRSRTQRSWRKRNPLARITWELDQLTDDIEQVQVKHNQSMTHRTVSAVKVHRGSSKDAIVVERPVLIELLARLLTKTAKDAMRSEVLVTQHESGRLLTRTPKDAMDGPEPSCEGFPDTGPGRTRRNRDRNRHH